MFIDDYGRPTDIFITAFILVFIVVLGIVGYFKLSQTIDMEGLVVDKYWTKQVFIEAYQQISIDVEANKVPFDAYNCECYEEFVGMEETKIGDFSFWSAEYEDRCACLVDRWILVRSLQSTGKEEEYWPEYDLSAGDGQYGQERLRDDASVRKTNYIVKIDYSGDIKECSFSKEKWQEIQLESKIVTQKGILGWDYCEAN